MRDRNQVRLRRVLEVVMTARDSDFLPAGFLQCAYQVITLHGGYHTHRRNSGQHYTHRVPRTNRARLYGRSFREAEHRTSGSPRDLRPRCENWTAMEPAA